MLIGTLLLRPIFKCEFSKHKKILFKYFLQAIDGGFGAKGLTAFTGGCVETYDISDKSDLMNDTEKIFKKLLAAQKKNSLITTSTPFGWGRENGIFFSE